MIGDAIKVLSTLSKLCLWFGVLSGVIYAITTYSALELAIGSVALGVGLFFADYITHDSAGSVVGMEGEIV